MDRRSGYAWKYRRDFDVWCSSSIHVFLFLLAADATASVAVGFFAAYSTSKKEVNQLAAMCDKQSLCMSGVLIFHTKSEW
jgi:hypothetical protein